LAGLERQIARIADLLGELEHLTRTSATMPIAVRRRARLLTQRARWVVQPWAQPDDEFEGDPQPEIDDESVERMYRHLCSDN